MRRLFSIGALAGTALATSGLMFVQFSPLGAQSRNLEIYWIDTEGGAATLIVMPSGESLLVDTGYADGDRDAKRIFAAAQQAGLRRIDHVVISHYHQDHSGGLGALVKMIPIDNFYDHGDTADEVDRARLDSYRTVAGGKRKIVKPGDEIPLKGVSALIVASDGKVLENAVSGGAPNPLCADAARMTPAADENGRAVGVLLTYNTFTFLNLVDLDWSMEMELACPLNKLGQITLFQASRHGSSDDGNAPGFLGAIKPQVVVVSNGPRKGLGQVNTRYPQIKPIEVAGQPSVPYEKKGYLRLARNPGIEGIWQGHLSLLDKDPAHNTVPDMIANLDEIAECQGHAITASVAADGKYTMTNTRNGFNKSYTARKTK